MGLSSTRRRAKRVCHMGSGKAQFREERWAFGHGLLLVNGNCTVYVYVCTYGRDGGAMGANLPSRGGVMSSSGPGWVSPVSAAAQFPPPLLRRERARGSRAASRLYLPRSPTVRSDKVRTQGIGQGARSLGLSKAVLAFASWLAARTSVSYP
jgi:hypothetical protein